MVARLGAMVNSADIILRSGALLKKYVRTRPRVDAAREDPHAADAAFSAPLAPALIRAFPLDATRADPLDAPANPSILPPSPRCCHGSPPHPPPPPRLVRYEHYLPDVEMAPVRNPEGGKADSFTQMHASLTHTLGELKEKSEAVATETNRAAAAAANAEIRRGKNFLRGELPKLRKVMAKKSKGLTEEEKTAREEMVDALEYAIECVKDGVTRQAPPPPPSRRGGSGAAGSGAGSSGATVDVSKLTSGQGTNMEHSEQSRAFRAEFEEAKRRQDEGLDEISKGLSVLKNLGEEMDEEVKRQAPIMDAIDDKLDSSAEELRTANGKLKRVITDMRSTRHFCIDVILIFIILGIGLYLFNTLG